MAARVNFTDDFVRGVQPIPGKRRTERDSNVRRLYLFVEASGHRSFYIVYTINRRPRMYKIGSTDIMTVKAARKEAMKLLGDVARGSDPQAERRAKRGGLTFEQLHKRYVEEWAKQHNKSWKETERLVRNNVYKTWAKLPASSITRGEVKRLLGSLKAKQTANLLRAALSAVFTFAVDEAEVLSFNPCRGVRDNPTNERDRVLSAAEVSPFWVGCEAVDPVKAAALRTIVLTGQRGKEVRHMRWEHIKGDWWEMPGKLVPELGWPGTKNKASHRVYLAAKVREIIEASFLPGKKPTEGFVFANERGNAIAGLDAAMRAISEAQKLSPAVRPHDLRRTMGSTITGRGHGREAMDRILNHRKKSVTDVYDRHDYAKVDQKIMEDVCGHLMRLVEGRQEDNVVAMRRAEV